jgi:hypothetical protein
MSNFLLSVEMQNSSLYMVKSVIVKSVKIATNVLQLGEVADLEAQKFNFALKFIRNPNVQFSTKPAILPNCCCMPFYSFR